MAQWTALVKQLGLEKEVVFHGVKYGTELDEMFDYVDVGIGTLGLYRKQFSFSSILKIREYCARGLPFVYAGDDPAFEGQTAFCMQVPNDDSIIDVQAVMSFAENMRDKAGVMEDMRRYASSNISWKVQMQKIFTALEVNNN